MSTVTRDLGSITDLASRRVDGYHGNFKVGDLVSRKPPKWSTTCLTCGAQGTHLHTDLMQQGARCKNPACGKQQLSEELADTPAKARARERAAQEKAQAAKEQAHADRLAAEEAKLKKTHADLLKVQKENLLNMADDDFLDHVFDKETPATMSQAEATAYNKKEASQFIRDCPGYFPSRKNMDSIAAYLRANGSDVIVSAVTLRRTYAKLQQMGILEKRPAEPVQQAPAYQAPVNLSIEQEPEQPRIPTYKGLDHNGREIELTQIQLDRLSAADYKVFSGLRRVTRRGN